MTFEEFNADITRYIEIVRLDLAALENIAEEVAQKEIMEIRVPPPTTNPHGMGQTPIAIAESRCTVPITMVCFSVIDFIGKLCDTNDAALTPKDLDDFEKHAKVFFTRLALRDDLKNGHTLNILQDFYRHSIMHSFLPVKNKGIGYSVSYTYHIEDNSLFSRSYTGMAILNVRYLLARVRDGLSAFEAILQEPALAADILENYKKHIQA